MDFVCCQIFKYMNHYHASIANAEGCWTLKLVVVELPTSSEGSSRGGINFAETQQSGTPHFAEIKNRVSKMKRRRGSDAGQSRRLVRSCSWYPQIALLAETFEKHHKRNYSLSRLATLNQLRCYSNRLLLLKGD